MTTEAPESEQTAAPAVISLRHHRGIPALTLAKLISTTGAWANTVAMPWFVLTTTGSPAKMSFVFAAQAAGIVLLGLPSSAVITRLGVRRTLLAGDAARIPLICLIPVLHHLDLLAFPLLLLVVFVIGGFTASYVAAQRIAIPQLVGEEPRIVGRASSLVDGATRVGNLAGPVIAGLLIGVIGVVNVLWFTAATFLVSFLIVLSRVRPRQRRPERGPAGTAEQRAGSRWIPAGYRVVAIDPVLRWMGISLLLVGVTYPLLMVVLPVLTTTRYDGDPRVYGALVSASGLGLALGSILAVVFIGRWQLSTLGGVASVGAMAPLWLLLISLPPLALGAVFAVSGLFIPVFSACLTSYFLLYTSPELRPQVMTGVVAMENTAGFVAYAVGGLLVAGIGAQRTLLLVALTGTGCSLALLVAVLRILRR
ncbi:MAG TPA: MFS transporter [Candidatus Limnocylindrales bacterium]